MSSNMKGTFALRVIRFGVLWIWAVAVLASDGSAAAFAQENAQRPMVKSVLPTSAGLGDTIKIEVEGLSSDIQSNSLNVSSLRLFMNGRLFKGLEAVSYDREANQVAFELKRSAVDSSTWATLLGAPPSSGQRTVAVGVGTEADGEFPSLGDNKPKMRLIIFDPGWMWAAALGMAIVAGLLIVLAAKSDILRDPRPTNLPIGQRRPFSLARFQMAFWLVLITGSFLFVWIITGDYNDIVTAQSLTLLGISGATAMGGVLADAGKPLPAGKTWPVATNFFEDILTDVNGVALHRFQSFVWTIVLGLVFVVEVYQSLMLPKFDATLLTMIGISGGLYVGFKWPEQQVK